MFDCPDHSVDERDLLLARTIQITDMTTDGVGMRGGCARHQFALPFGGRGLVHNDADFLLGLDSATPPK